MWVLVILMTCVLTRSEGIPRAVSTQLNQTSSASFMEWLEDGMEPLYEFKQSNSRQINDHVQGDQNLCPQRTTCLPLSDCRLLTHLMERSCLIASRLKELTCGYQGLELMICCPHGGTNSPFTPGVGDSDDDDKGGGAEQLNQKCGKPQLNGWQGGYSGLGSHPWGVRVGFKNGDSGVTEYPCGGSLITPTVVLTAAHCAVAKAPGRSISVVRVGEYDMRTDPDCTNNFCAHPVQIIPVASVIVHPGYEKSTFRHDVALIVTKKPVNYTLGSQPICLVQPSSILSLVGTRPTLLGFGKLPDQDSVTPVQHQLELPVVSSEVCSRIYDKVIKITSNHLCVGGEPKRDACSGFGGSPLVLLDPIRRDRYLQIGIVSFGSDKCGAAGVPSVYTSIAPYYPWIVANIP